MIVIVAFFVLLLLGIPISMVVLGASTLGVILYSGTPLQIVVQQMFSGLNNYVLLAIPFFIVSGTIASRGSTSKYLCQVMTIIFGRMRGGSVIAAVAACAFFAAISGSSFATIVAIGSIMLPSLKEQEFPDEMSIGCITAGGSIGVLIPPSAPMIALCVALGSSVGRQFMAGVVPGLILALAWGVYTYVVCSIKKYGKPIRYSFSEAKGIIFKAIPALLYPVIILGSIYGGLATPTESAAISIVYVILVELFVYRTTSFKDLFNAFKNSLVNSAGITFIISASQLLTWFITTQRLPAIISDWIVTTITSPTVFLLVIMGIFFVAGCFMELVALMIILGPILSPTLASYGVDPIHFGIICVLAAQVSYLTPPFGMNLFVTMNMTKRSLGYVSKAAMPYLIILILCMLLIAFVPEFSLWLPNLMMGS